jgi:hypothetical protein
LPSRDGWTLDHVDWLSVHAGQFSVRIGWMAIGIG